MPLWGAYSLRNLWARRVTALFTLLGMGLVVFVFLAVLMLAHGLERTMGATGDPANVVLLRKGAMSEAESSIGRDHAQSILVQPGIQSTPEGRVKAVREIGLQVTLRKAQGRAQPGVLASFSLRGTSPEAFDVRPNVRIVEGRLWEPGTTELVVGAQVAKQFPETRLHQRLRFGNREWTVVGILAAGGSGFESEVWGDAEQLMRTFHRTAFSSVTLRLTAPADWEAWKARVERDPRFSLGVKRETDLFEGKAATMVRLIRTTGLFLTTVFSIGAVLGATMTMSTSVAQRTTEIATLRTIGFTRAAIVQTFLLESLLLGGCAGLLGVVGALWLQLVTISTTNFETGAEIVFGFQLTSAMIAFGLLFAVGMSLLGGLVPSLRAARLEIVQALGERTA